MRKIIVLIVLSVVFSLSLDVRAQDGKEIDYKVTAGVFAGDIAKYLMDGLTSKNLKTLQELNKLADINKIDAGSILKVPVADSVNIEKATKKIEHIGLRRTNNSISSIRNFKGELDKVRRSIPTMESIQAMVDQAVRNALDTMKLNLGSSEIDTTKLVRLVLEALNGNEPESKGSNQQFDTSILSDPNFLKFFKEIISEVMKEIKPNIFIDRSGSDGDNKGKGSKGSSSGARSIQRRGSGGNEDWVDGESSEADDAFFSLDAFSFEWNSRRAGKTPYPSTGGLNAAATWGMGKFGVWCFDLRSTTTGEFHTLTLETYSPMLRLDMGLYGTFIPSFLGGVYGKLNSDPAWTDIVEYEYPVNKAPFSDVKKFGGINLSYINYDQTNKIFLGVKARVLYNQWNVSDSRMEPHDENRVTWFDRGEVFLDWNFWKGYGLFGYAETYAVQKNSEFQVSVPNMYAGLYYQNQWVRFEGGYGISNFNDALKKRTPVVHLGMSLGMDRVSRAVQRVINFKL